MLRQKKLAQQSSNRQIHGETSQPPFSSMYFSIAKIATRKRSEKKDLSQWKSKRNDSELRLSKGCSKGCSERCLEGCIRGMDLRDGFYVLRDGYDVDFEGWF